MGGHAQVTVNGDPELLDLAVGRLEQLEARWSRFLPASDVSMANASAGQAVPVGPDTLLLCSFAEHARALTSGRFDPLLGRNLEALGYDRSFEHLDPTRGRPPSAIDGPLTPAVVLVDAERGTITVPEGRSFDPGGIGKGLAGDLVAADVLDAGAMGVMVNLGGDVRAGGVGPTGDGWSIGVEDPWAIGHELFRLCLVDGAVASSSRLRRRWQVGADEHHHLLEPRDGRPIRNGMTAVTVVAATGWQAEAFTKLAFVAGPDAAVAELEEQGVDGVVILDDGRQLRTAGLGR